VAQPPYKSRAEGYVPSPQQLEQAKRWYEERGLHFDPPPEEAQGTSREEISQSTMETHQAEKGRDHLSSKREMIETLRSVMDKLNEKRAREQRLLLERDSEILAARTLLSDKQSTCHDPCSETPASVDCIKQCETNVSSDPSACLDVSISDVLAKVEPVSGLPAPNQQVRLNYTLSVQNHCPQTIKSDQAIYLRRGMVAAGIVRTTGAMQ